MSSLKQCISLYCSSTKYAVRGLMDALLLELRQQQTPQVNDQVNLTVVHPFVVNTGLAQKPSTRFTTLIPFTEASEAASIILTGVKNNDFEVFVPQRLFYLFASSHILPSYFIFFGTVRCWCISFIFNDFNRCSINFNAF